MSDPAKANAARPRRVRGVRDWVVDTLLFLFALGVGLLTAGSRVESGALPHPPWLFELDQFIGLLGCLALWLRRRWPVGLALVLVAASTWSEIVAGAMLVSLFTVAVHRPPKVALLVYGLSVVSGLIFVFLRPEPDTPWSLLFGFGVTIQGAMLGWGLFIQHRRQLVLSLRDRAVRAEAEAHLRAEQAQHRAREAIAREIHDVLGHRLSLLSVHAGALEYRPDAPPEEVTRAAGVIRESAHQALQDLREVIGVLRAPVGELPQPTLADLDELVAESGRAGMEVDLRAETAGAVPDRVGRTAYRIVQEALTNARTHAPGSAVRASVAGAPGEGLRVEVSNAAPDPTAGPSPGPRAGQGLVGLAERVAIANGRLEHGPTADGGWRLAAWLPWPP